MISARDLNDTCHQLSISPYDGIATLQDRQRVERVQARRRPCQVGAAQFKQMRYRQGSLRAQVVNPLAQIRQSDLRGEVLQSARL